jgi:predicted transcriptional regulator
VAHASICLNDVERKVLDEIREWYRRLYVEKFEGSLSFERIARRLDVDPVQVRWAVERLLELGLVAVKPGAGGRANTYLPCLPRRVAKLMSTAAAAADVPPF